MAQRCNFQKESGYLYPPVQKSCIYILCIKYIGKFGNQILRNLLNWLANRNSAVFIESLLIIYWIDFCCSGNMQMFCEVIDKHNHPFENAAVLSKLPVTNSTKKQITQLLEKGLSPSLALAELRHTYANEPSQLANRRLVPDYHYVKR